MSTASKVVHNEAENRYEIWLDDELAGFTQYTEQDGVTTFIHTEIGDAFGGKGLGSVLAHQALDDVVSRGNTIVPICPFIAGYIDKHPEYAPHVHTR